MTKCAHTRIIRMKLTSYFLSLKFYLVLNAIISLLFILKPISNEFLARKVNLFLLAKTGHQIHFLVFNKMFPRIPMICKTSYLRSVNNGRRSCNSKVDPTLLNYSKKKQVEILVYNNRTKV